MNALSFDMLIGMKSVIVPKLVENIAAYLFTESHKDWLEVEAKPKVGVCVHPGFTVYWLKIAVYLQCNPFWDTVVLTAACLGKGLQFTARRLAINSKYIDP